MIINSSNLISTPWTNEMEISFFSIETGFICPVYNMQSSNTYRSTILSRWVKPLRSKHGRKNNNKDFILPQYQQFLYLVRWILYRIEILMEEILESQSQYTFELKGIAFHIWLWNSFLTTMGELILAKPVKLINFVR